MREINFSIVIPTWKRAGLVERLLASLDADRKQYQYGKTEVLVIDNSQGEEKERIEKACGAYRARYIEGVESVRKSETLELPWRSMSMCSLSILTWRCRQAF